MGFYEEVDQIRSHEPLDLLLDINGGDIWKCLALSLVSWVYMKSEAKAIDLHIFHVSNDILHVGITGLSRQLIGHCFLFPTTLQLQNLGVSLLWVGLFDEERITRLLSVVRHIGRLFESVVW